jgi:2-polyprenyl-6-methoxyphenol hydroxylase-like FAD-dependent oxidoreductase
MAQEIIETPVLVVGGGPVGLAMTIDLGTRGIPSILIEQGDGTIEHPRTGLVAVRTMEAFRQWGIADKVRACGFPEDYELSMVFCTSLTGLLLDREAYPSMREAPTPPETPEKKQRCPQLWLQPILLQTALDNPLTSVMFKHRFEEFEQSEDCIHAVVRDLDTDHTKTIRAQYLLGCDGPTSLVRSQAGIDMEGRLLSYSINILINAPNLVKHHTMGEGERYMFVGPTGMWGNLTVVDGTDTWRLTVLGSNDRIQLDTFDPRYWVCKAFGTLETPERIPFEVLSVTPWRRSEMLATQYVNGRVALVGDSAHTMSPTGGMGMNTGIQEVLDIGWKLQGLLQGWAGSKLLPSYELERRPIAKRNISFSTQNFKAWQDTPEPDAVCDDTPEGAAVRAAIGKRLRDSTKVEWESMGLQLGHRYEDSPICVPDGSAPTSDDFKDYIPTARPGARAPHAWLKDGRSTLDLFGSSFVLLHFPSGETSSAAPLVDAFDARKIPLNVITLMEQEIAALYERQFVLVRPDGHVAWRADAIDDALKIADTVRGAA